MQAIPKDRARRSNFCLTAARSAQPGFDARWKVRRAPLGYTRGAGTLARRRSSATPGEANMISAALEANKISAAFPYRKQRRQVLGSEMACVEGGQGDPLVLVP